MFCGRTMRGLRQQPADDRSVVEGPERDRARDLSGSYLVVLLGRLAFSPDRGREGISDGGPGGRIAPKGKGSGQKKIIGP